MSRQLSFFLVVIAACCLLLPSCSRESDRSAQPASAPAVSAGQAETSRRREPIYDEQADAKAQIARAVERAAPDGKRVLLMYGGNWCGWCYKLHDLMASDQKIATLLRDEYELVMVDINKNPGVAEQYTIARVQGVPYLTVLDTSGQVVTNQETGSFEKNGAHDPAAVLAFLTKWKADSLDARQVYQRALATAEKENKIVFLRLGSPTCGWCRRFDDFLHREEIAKMLAADYVLVKIDLARMKGGLELQHEIRAEASGGIPWFVFMDGKGKQLATSDGANGNIGFPAQDDEIAHFKGMLLKTAKHLKPDQIERIAILLQEQEMQRQHAQKKPASTT